MSSQAWWENAHKVVTHKPPDVYPETRLWTLTKDGREATAAIRHLPHGSELQFRVNGTLMLSQLFRDGAGAQLGILADKKKRDFEARGWRA